MKTILVVCILWLSPLYSIFNYARIMDHVQQTILNSKAQKWLW